MNIRIGLIIVLLSITLLIGCNSRNESETIGNETVNSDFSKLITELDGLGYYQYTDATLIDQIKKDCIEYGYLYGWEDTNRDFSADAESLAEGGVCDFLNMIQPFLILQNIDLKDISQIFSGFEYVIKIDNQDYVIYSSEESDSEELWEITANRTCSMINKLLEDSSSDERAYLLYEGNDLRVLFLTDEIYALIMDSDIPNDEKPVKVIDMEIM